MARFQILTSIPLWRTPNGRRGGVLLAGALCGIAALTVAGALAPARAGLPPDDVDPSRGCTIVGTKAGDVLKGTDGDDVICGGGGGDTIHAGAGNDVIYGDGGGDTIHAGPGNDVVYGGDGGDTIYGEDGDDRVFGGESGDTVWGGPGDDMLDGEDGADTLRGGNGEDRLVGGPGADTAWGDDGQDLIVGGEGADSVKGNQGDDVLLGGAGGDSHYGDAGTDTCVGSGGVNAFYLCELKRTAADFGGVDGDLDGDGASDEDEARAGTNPLVADQTGLTYTLNVAAGCEPGLALSVTARQDVVTEGDEALFDVLVRNDPAGACLASGGTPTTVAGAVTATAKEAQGGGFEGITAWLEVPAGDGSGASKVLPASSGLTTTGATGAASCPGGNAEGCASVGAKVGYVNVAGGQSQEIGPGETATIGFRYFPTLAAQDLQLLSGGAEVRLAVAVSEASGGVAVMRLPVSVGSAQPTGIVTVDAELPDGATAQISLLSVGAGQQTESLGAFAYQTGPSDGHSITAHFTATAPDVADAATADVVVVVESDRSGLSSLESSIYPERANVGVATEFTVSTRPAGTVAADPQIVWDSGSAALTDDGTGGDLLAGDGVFTAKFSWAPTTAGLKTLTVSGVVAGQAASDAVQVAVYPDGVPTQLYTGPHAGIISDADGGEYYSDMLDISTEPGVDFALVEAAAASVGGIVVGAFLGDRWQIQIPPVASWGELEAVAQTLAANPIVVLIEPEGLIYPGEDTIQPNDPVYTNQRYLDDFGLDDAWAFNTGRTQLVVAVLDTGFDVNHPDLNGNIIPGKDYGSKDNNVAPDSACPIDRDHGTHVAGIIGAESNNGTGVTGVNWNVKLLTNKITVCSPVPSGEIRALGLTPYQAEAIVASVAAGARVINISFSGSERSSAVAAALHIASDKNVVVVASAGNSGTSSPMYPAAFARAEVFTGFGGSVTYNTDVLSVGSMDSPTQRSSFSNFGEWVQLWAPGRDVQSTVTGGGYHTMSGTSMAAPFVSGLASLILSHPGYATRNASYVRSRLQSTSSGHPAGQLGWVVDGYQAVSNASFEAELDTVTAQGTVDVVDRLGPITPRSGWGKKMLQLSTGPGAAQTKAQASLDLALPVAALSKGNLQVDLCYNYVTEEYPEWVGSEYNDKMRIRVISPGGGEIGQIDESVNVTNWTSISGIDFPGGDSTVGESGWKCASIAVPAASLQHGDSGPFPALRIVVEDLGDAIYDSVVLVDNITVSST
ncbi:MAG: S8 family serine peptidase [Bifidobacteriaceae bacterium]|jgi:hypothetical protein|nr:S8 family serine peptidase [Bifidobacteriaceae bacterium]